ncbi:uncharacterized protein [Amphiura filiformis]|uniref:uncharacterized protein n=1 Tax=Amphiura filiformis TaxID=82378 RepID=UPI003B20CFD2
MELSDIVLRSISSNMGSEWEKLASYLGFSQAKIEQFFFFSTVRGIENAMFTMLVTWREQQPVGTTNYRRELKSALEKCGRCDLADIIHEVSPQVQLDAIYSSLTSKLKTKPNLFEDAINAFYTGYVSMTNDSEIAAALINFGQSIGAGNTEKEEANQEVWSPKKWKQHKKISNRSAEVDDVFSSTKDITWHQSGDFAVVDDIEHAKPEESGNGAYSFSFNVETQMLLSSNTSVRSMMYVFGEDGTERFVINASECLGKPCGMAASLKLNCDVAVTKQGYFAVTDNTKQVKLFDIKGENVGSFTISDDDKGNRDRARCIAVNANGEIYVGDFTEQVISVHNADDFTKLRDIYISIKPCYIAANSRGHVCVVTFDIHILHQNNMMVPKEYSKVAIFDDSGNEISTISPTVWGKNVTPLGVVYDADDTLLLAAFDRSINRGGHVHRYGKKGEFLECIIKGTEQPSGIALRNNTLAIADGKSVLIYKGE